MKKLLILAAAILHISLTEATFACNLNPKYDTETEGLSLQITNVTRGDIASMEWHFGDGSISHDTNPLHWYEKEGTYDLLMVVSSTDGCRTVRKSVIHVFDTPGGTATAPAAETQGQQNSNIAGLLHNLQPERISNMPNPVGETTSIAFSVAESGNVAVRLYDIEGTLVGQLANGDMQKGTHSLTFNRNGLPAGVYLLQMETAGGRQTHKMVLK